MRQARAKSQAYVRSRPHEYTTRAISWLFPRVVIKKASSSSVFKNICLGRFRSRDAVARGVDVNWENERRRRGYWSCEYLPIACIFSKGLDLCIVV